MGLHGTITPPSEITEEDITRMFHLMSTYYDNVAWNNFYSDLSEKEQVVILRDNARNIQGFSTLMTLDIDTLKESGKDIKIVFSGDTVIEKKFWGSNKLLFVWGKYVMIDLAQKFPGVPLYWILISKGYTTYRFLPRHFIEFYPRHDISSIPQIEKNIMDIFGCSRYPGRYNSKTGIISSCRNSDRVKSGTGKIRPRHMENPDIAYFIKKNPGHTDGDELVCITRASLSNLKSDIRKWFV